MVQEGSSCGQGRQQSRPIRVPGQSAPPFDPFFSPTSKRLTQIKIQSLVKLNNIEEARRLLDTMSLSLNAEAVGAVLDKHPLPTSPEGTRWLFTIKVVSGEKLVAPDGSRGTLESFVALHDLAGYQISRTRTVQDSNDPRWEQSFDIMLRNELMVQATVYSRITGKDAEIGRARFHLDPSEFQPLVRRDLLLPLEGAHGPSKILVRIRMEPETDDPRFYFGRAFRSLKRTEKEMARVIVSKVSICPNDLLFFLFRLNLPPPPGAPCRTILPLDGDPPNSPRHERLEPHRLPDAPRQDAN